MAAAARGCLAFAFAGGAAAATAALSGAGWRRSPPAAGIASASPAYCREQDPPNFAQLTALWATIQARKAEANDSKSWTARLLRKGTEKCAQKVGEEATEVVIEAAARRPDGLVKESADLLYHLFVLWTSVGIEPQQVMDELARREMQTGLQEKASRPKS
eukprot:TRINITY_DN66839_c0_g1_i1.p2 TRINITY_DN66839_c0_g1~~TRINITY_DN66839_c0_g1_i1.p2  ORF type:complete len:188 (-),score=41.20 TRINITY_DN66839_c0_g1_i1:281-760(-)